MFPTPQLAFEKSQKDYFKSAIDNRQNPCSVIKRTWNLGTEYLDLNPFANTEQNENEDASLGGNLTKQLYERILQKCLTLNESYHYFTC